MRHNWLIRVCCDLDSVSLDIDAVTFKKDSTLIRSNPCVASFTPRCAPRVLDDEVILTVIGTIADWKNSMVQVLATTCLDNTASVVSEEIVLTLNCYGNWSVIQSHFEHHSILIDIIILIDESVLIFDIDFLALVSVFTIVLVSILERGSHFFIFQVLPGVLLEASVASSTAD